MKRTLHETSPTAAGDGAFVMWWRLLVQYPEILAWHKQWFLSQEDVYAQIYGTVKAIKPEAEVGWHIMQYVTLSPFFQADQDYSRIIHYADYLKPCPYNNAGGPLTSRTSRPSSRIAAPAPAMLVSFISAYFRDNITPAAPGQAVGRSGCHKTPGYPVSGL